MGAGDPDLTDGVGIDDRILIEEEFVTRSTSVGIVETDSTADTALLSFVKAAYDAGASAGDYLILRLNPDRNIDGADNQGNYRFAWGGGLAPNDEYPTETYGTYVPPVLELTTGESVSIPAPAALPAGMTILAIVAARRRR